MSSQNNGTQARSSNQNEDGNQLNIKPSRFLLLAIFQHMCILTIRRKFLQNRVIRWSHEYRRISQILSITIDGITKRRKLEEIHFFITFIIRFRLSLIDIIHVKETCSLDLNNFEEQIYVLHFLHKIPSKSIVIQKFPQSIEVSNNNPFDGAQA